MDVMNVYIAPFRLHGRSARRSPDILMRLSRLARRRPAKRDVHRTVIQRISPQFIEAYNDVDRVRRCDGFAVAGVEITGERSSSYGMLANPAFQEVSGERGLGQHEHGWAVRQGFEPGEELAEARKVSGVIAFAGLQLRNSDIHDGGHERTIAFRGVSLEGRRDTMKTMRAALILLLAAGTAAAQDTAKPGGTGEPWQIIQPPQSSLVFARDGSFIGEIGRQTRTSVPLGSVPAYVYQSFIAVEDQRFYQHAGVDMVGLAGAIKDNILGEKRGGSTIT